MSKLGHPPDKQQIKTGHLPQILVILAARITTISNPGKHVCLHVNTSIWVPGGGGGFSTKNVSN